MWCVCVNVLCCVCVCVLCVWQMCVFVRYVCVCVCARARVSVNRACLAMISHLDTLQSVLQPNRASVMSEDAFYARFQVSVCELTSYSLGLRVRPLPFCGSALRVEGRGFLVFGVGLRIRGRRFAGFGLGFEGLRLGVEGEGRDLAAYVT